MRCGCTALGGGLGVGLARDVHGLNARTDEAAAAAAASAGIRFRLHRLQSLPQPLLLAERGFGESADGFVQSVFPELEISEAEAK